MPSRLKRYHESGQTHFITFTCFHRLSLLECARAKRTVEMALERVRRAYRLCVYGYVVMPEHVHLLVSEPEPSDLAQAIKSLKQGVSRRLIGERDRFWQTRYYDRNVRCGLCARPEDWAWSSFLHYAKGSRGSSGDRVVRRTGLCLAWSSQDDAAALSAIEMGEGQMLRLYVLLALLVASCVTRAETAPRIRTSLAYSCLTKPFISISASTPGRDSIPLVGISITDPLARKEDVTSNRNDIPESSYGPVVEIPKLPRHSVAVAMEICNATQGVYEITVAESGDKPYRLTVSSAGITKSSEALVLHHKSQQGRIRRYKFVFRIEGNHLTLRWIDRDASEQYKIEASEW